MEEPKYDLYKFDDLIKSTDWSNNLMGIIMLKAYLPIKSLNLEELEELEESLGKVHYGCKIWNQGWWEVKGKILCKINNQRQKIEKKQRKIQAEEF